MKTFKECRDELHAGINFEAVPEREVKTVAIQVILDALVVAVKSGAFEMTAISEANEAIQEVFAA